MGALSQQFNNLLAKVIVVPEIDITDQRTNNSSEAKDDSDASIPDSQESIRSYTSESVTRRRSNPMRSTTKVNQSSVILDEDEDPFASDDSEADPDYEEM